MGASRILSLYASHTIIGLDFLVHQPRDWLCCDIGNSALFDCHGFDQIARLINVRALYQSNVIGQQLHRDSIGERRNQRVDNRHFNGRNAALARLCQACRIGNQHHLPAARAHYLHIGDGFFEQRARRRNHHHRNGIVNQRDRAMLHFARGIAFCVDVADFFEL